ncbi:helix-turn-helix domain-containing protein [Prolixibacteraceae bacterium JC049]|nr:helix-turn-helix domain-containing protein [Prolixibacteraceae bacterium JC049]
MKNWQRAITQLFLGVCLLLLGNNVKAQNRCFKSNPNYIVVNSDRFKEPTKQLTIEMWVKIRTKKEWCAPLSFITDNGHRESGYAFAYTREKMRFMLKTDNMRGDEWNYNPGVDLEVNQWTHLAGTYDGETIKMYQNGELVESKTTSGEINWDYPSDKLYIGVFKDFNENLLFDGQLDEIRIWNYARSNEQILEFKNRKLSGSERGLMAYYHFDNARDNVVSDASKNKLDGELNIPAKDHLFLPSGAMVVPQVKEVKVTAPDAISLNWKALETVYDFDYYWVDISKSRSFDQLIAHQKIFKTEAELKNLEGGSNLFIRVKGFSKEIGFTGYSDILELSDFSTALSINVVTQSGDDKTITHKLIDYNVLTSNYIGLPHSTKDVLFHFNLKSNKPERILPGKIQIIGQSQNYESKFSQNTDMSILNLKPGKYTIKAQWGSIDQDRPLNIELEMEIKAAFYQQLGFQIVFLILLVIVVLFLAKRYRIISVTKLNALIKEGNAKENKADWMEPDVVAKNAQLIKAFVENDKPYLDQKFNLKALADKVDLPHYQISKVLSDHYGMNFNDFINEYRVKEFVKLMNSEENRKMKNSAIAYQCGFYSDSTFFRAFKKFMGKTPQQYLNELGEVD